jgi:hypothetical protein
MRKLQFKLLCLALLIAAVSGEEGRYDVKSTSSFAVPEFIDPQNAPINSTHHVNSEEADGMFLTLWLMLSVSVFHILTC